MIISGCLAMANADCGWTSTCGPRGCADCKDDGSAGYKACCGGGGGGGGGGPVTEYCPNTAQDFKTDYEDDPGRVSRSGRGWTIHGGGRVSSKASFNCAGGSVEFDMDLSRAINGVNNNVYATYPSGGDSAPYCDSGRDTPSGHCAENDWTENNGNCMQATTWHRPADGSDHDGHPQYTGGLSNHVHVKVTWSADGSTQHVSVGGNNYDGDGFQDVMQQQGFVIYSSQWTGWVPGHCPNERTDHDAKESASFGVSNVRIVGRVVQGPEPTKCNGRGSNSSYVVV